MVGCVNSVPREVVSTQLEKGCSLQPGSSLETMVGMVISYTELLYFTDTRGFVRYKAKVTSWVGRSYDSPVKEDFRWWVFGGFFLIRNWIRIAQKNHQLAILCLWGSGMKRSWMEKPTNYVLNSFSQETFQIFRNEITMEWMKLPVYAQKIGKSMTQKHSNVPLEVRING